MKTHAGRKLSRPTGARMSMLRTLASDILQHERVETTVAKAREASRVVEGLLALAKRGDLVSRRRVAAAVPRPDVRRKIFDVLVPRYQSRVGGCTQVHRLGRRLSDGAEMAIIKLIA
jgi:large subunit ribosomal protein L17